VELRQEEVQTVEKKELQEGEEPGQAEEQKQTVFNPKMFDWS
jgi:hypothetical protein